MANKNSVVVWLASTESSTKYVLRRKKGAEKLELKKYDPRVKKHVLFKEKKYKS